MKGIHRIYGITVAFLALWIVINAKAPTKCPYPEEFPENTTTNIPHEFNCTKFYKCLVGKGIEQDCPLMIPGDKTTRLHYNRELQVCDWPWMAGCHVCPPKDENGEWPDALLPHKNSCQKYFKCENGKPILQHCEDPNTCFSRTCQACVYHREGGYCGKKHTSTTSSTKPTRPSTTSSTSSTTSSTSSTTPCWKNVKYPHECNCAMYYECIDGEKSQFQCDGGLHFSRTTQSCEDPDKANCILPKYQ